MITWFERDRDKYEAERKFWLGNGFAEERSANKLSFVGSVEVAVGEGEGPLTRREFKLRVTYPPAFPYRPPDVEFIDPPIRRSRHQSPRGLPCLFPPRDWDPSMETSQVHKAIQRWLRGWMLGSFPRELAIYELPEYFPYSPLSILVTPEAFAVFEGSARGRFSLLRAQGRDLAVLRTVDGKQAASTLLGGLNFGSEVRQDVANGKWFRLAEEPEFIRHTSELSELLARSGHQWSASRTPTEDGFVGLVFEDRVLEEERLLVLDYSAEKKAKPEAQGWPLRAPWVYLVSRNELFRRLEGVHSVETLQERTVLMLGLGAIGSSLALDLAREGVGGFVLCDPDRLRPGNVMRHALDLFSVGQSKAAGTELAIGRVNPDAETWTETDNLEDPGVLENLMREDAPLRGAHLVVSAIGDNAIEGLVSEVAVRSRSAPVLFVRTLHDGDATRLFLLRPGTDDACLECLRLHHRDEHPDLIFVPDSELRPVHDAGCGTSAQPGAGLASRQAALFGAKRALSLLLGEETEDNHWLWVARAIPAAEDARLHVPERMRAARLTRHRKCPQCTSD